MEGGRDHKEGEEGKGGQKSGICITHNGFSP